MGSSGTPNEQQLPGACNVAFNSLPTIHINEQTAPQEVRSMQNQLLFSSDSGGRILLKSYPKTIACEESMGLYASKDFLMSQQTCHQRKYFALHWSVESVNEALEKGNVFKVLFRVNAHNRLEAYCKIDGVQTDVPISGIAAQNRAALLFGTFMEDETRSWLKQSYEKPENHVEKNEKHVEKKELEVGSSNVGTGLSFG